MKRRLDKRIVAALVIVSTVSSALAWRDLAHRSDDAVRGKKMLWRILITLNPGNSVFYWLLGRR